MNTGHKQEAERYNVQIDGVTGNICGMSVITAKMILLITSEGIIRWIPKNANWTITKGVN